MESPNISIAEISFAVSLRNKVILQELDPAYQTFCCKKTVDADTITVRIQPESQGPWDIGKLAGIFETGRSWSIYRDGTTRILTVNPPGFEKDPLCMAGFEEAVEEVTVFYNKIHMKETDGRLILPNPFSYPLDRLLMMYALAKRKGAMFHAAGIEMSGGGYMFAGLSGTGKSTLSRQFVSLKGPVVLSDERVAVRKTGSGFRIFGTPWPGDERIAVNRGLPLSGIFLIGHGLVNSMEAIKPADAVQKLMPLMSIPWYDTAIMAEVLIFAEDLISSVPIYELLFTPGREIVHALHELAGKADAYAL